MDEIQKIPLAAHESEMTRIHKLVKVLLIGWAASVVMLGAVIYSYATAEYEMTEQTTTTTETTESADSGDYGNAIVGDGDITIGDGE